jgi:hypothetical protein
MGPKKEPKAAYPNDGVTTEASPPAYVSGKRKFKDGSVFVGQWREASGDKGVRHPLLFLSHLDKLLLKAVHGD